MVEGIAKLLSELVGRTPGLLIILGAAFLLLGLAGGVTYNQWFPIPEIEARILAGLGIVALAFGLYLTITPVPRPKAKEYCIKIDHPRDDDLPKWEEYGIKIDHPIKGADVDRIVNVSGPIAKPPPKGYTVKVFKIYPGLLLSDRLLPIRKAAIESGRWEAKQCDIGGTAGDERGIGVYLVGKNGSALLEYYALARDNYTLEEGVLKKLALKVRITLPPIANPTSDMIECDKVWVKRK